MLTGDWDLDEIASVNEEVAYTFFIVFTLVANFMLLNMFLAVIMEAYESLGEAKEVRGLSLKYDLTKGVGLYDLRYVRVGKISSSFKRYASKKAPQDRCLSLFCAGSKTIDLEVLGDAKERDAFAWAFDKIIGEARATRIFVDKAGAPVARSEPKKRLRMILGAH